MRWIFFQDNLNVSLAVIALSLNSLSCGAWALLWLTYNIRLVIKIKMMENIKKRPVLHFEATCTFKSLKPCNYLDFASIRFLKHLFVSVHVLLIKFISALNQIDRNNDNIRNNNEEK